MSIIEDLVDDPIAFLSRNALNMAGSVPKDSREPINFLAFANPAFKVRYRSGSKFFKIGNKKCSGTAYELRYPHPWFVATEATEKFTAVWSGYKGGTAVHCKLPSQGGPDVMLTPRVDGCTLTFAKDGNDMKFGHYNLMNVTGKSTKTGSEMREAAAFNYGDDNASVFSKEYYYSKAKRINTNTNDKRTCVNAVGVRKNRQWDFYVQYLESKGDGFQIRGAEQLKAGAKYIAPR
jgi:hypothetical protein